MQASASTEHTMQSPGRSLSCGEPCCISHAAVFQIFWIHCA